MLAKATTSGDADQLIPHPPSPRSSCELCGALYADSLFEASLPHISAMQPNLSPDDYAAIAALLRDTIAADRFLLSPRVRGWKAILDKLELPRPKPAQLPPPGER